MTDRQVLFVAYYFPPLGGAGVQRPLKFAKYLPELGWQPTVLTGGTGARYIHDPSLVADIPAGLQVERAYVFEPWRPLLRSHRFTLLLNHWLTLPDRQIGWFPLAYRQGLRLLKTGAFNAVYTTSVPYTAHLLGLHLKRATGLPWIADFRDEWTQNPSLPNPSPLHRRLHRKWEREVLTEADRVLAVSESITEGLRTLVLPAQRDKFYTLTNGYDPADFPAQNAYQRNQKFTVAYTGSLYGARTATAFLEALAQFIAHEPGAEDAIQVDFFGNCWVKSDTQRLGLDKTVKQWGYLSHHETIRRQCQADVLLLILPTTGGEGAISGKVFEYLASGRPILALVPPGGAAAKVIHQAQAGVVVEPENVQAIQNAFGQFYQAWITDTLCGKSDLNVVQQYDRRVLTGQLAAHLNALTHK
jgi:glycosyltransferase involved in cell wall biosynthesis